MVTRGQTIDQADLDALATLANAVGAPLSSDYEFNFLDDIEPPSDVVGVITYGSGNYIADGVQVLAHVYSYKDVSGRRHYSKKFAIGAVTPNNSSDNFEIEWNWTASPDSPDGYIFTRARRMIPASYAWNDTQNGYWQAVTSLPFADTFSATPGTQRLPRYNPVEGSSAYGGPWQRELNRLQFELFTLYTPALTWCVSGPWCVAIGPNLRFGTTNSSYDNVEFWFAADDHSGDVDFETVIEIGNSVRPLNFRNSVGTSTSANYQTSLTFDSAAAGTITGRMVWHSTEGGSGWSPALTVTSGAITITTTTWTEVDSTTLQLDFVADLPIGVSTLGIDVTAPAGYITPSEQCLDSVDRTIGAFYGSILYGTEAVAPTDVDAIHPSSFVKKAVPTAIDDTLGPMTFSGPRDVSGTNCIPSFRVADGMDGVWVAKTWPLFGVMSFVDVDLPNYWTSTSLSGVTPNTSAGIGCPAGSSARAKSPAVATEQLAIVCPAASNRPAVYPVFRDTDYGLWRKTNGDEDAPVPYFVGRDPFHAFELLSTSIVAGEVYHFTHALGAGFARLRIDTLAGVALYSSNAASPNPSDSGSYDTTGDGTLDFPTNFAYSPSQLLYFTAKNTTAETVRINIGIQYGDEADAGAYPGDEPVFFATDSDGLPDYERYSYTYSPGIKNAGLGGGDVHETPHSGYCVDRLTISRMPVDGVVPTTGEASLSVKVGVMHGVAFDNPGTFVEFDTFTILANEGSVTTEVFWPVIKGAALAYQASVQVNVEATVNFQPMVCSDFLCATYSGGAFTPLRGKFSGENFVGTDVTFASWVSRFTNQTDFNDHEFMDVTLPIAATTYNNIEAVLGVI